MRILHTSDWHIGRQFHNVSLLADQQFVLNQIVDIVDSRNIDVVLIAGDIYDRSVPPASAVALLDEILHKINIELKKPIIIISGNHDSGERLSFGARQLANSGIYISGTLQQDISPVLLSDEFGEIAFYSIPYVDPVVVRDVFKAETQTHDQALEFLTDKIKIDNKPGRRSVVLSHCFLDGGESSESERPLSVGGIDKVSATHFSDFDYVALGHLHGPQYKLQETIRYSGSILKYSFSECTQKKSVTVFELNQNGVNNLQKIALIPEKNMRIIEDYLENILEQGKDDSNNQDYLLVRLLDTHAILDIMAKLREVYPNVLHIERPVLSQAGERKLMDRSQLQKAELPMYLDFYQQMTGEPLNEAGTELITEMLDEIHQSERD